MDNRIYTKFFDKMLYSTEKVEAVERTTLVSIYALVAVYGFLHIFFMFVYLYFKIYEMAFLSLTSLLIVVINLYILVDIKKLTFGLTLAIGNFCYYVVAGTFFLGYEKNLTMLLPVFIFLIHTIFPKKAKYLVLNTIIVLIAYVLNFYLKLNHEAEFSNYLTNVEFVTQFLTLMLVVLIIHLKTSADKIVEQYTLNQIDGLVEEVGVLAEEASIDYLTGLCNRRYLEKKLETEDFIDSYIILCDIDYFKHINDQYGHLCGDYILKEVSGLFKASFRNIDDVCRWGGEEFLIFIKNASRLNVINKLERLRKSIEETVYVYEGVEFHITITFGVSKVDASLDIEKNIDRADSALYYGKNNGRNCVLSYLDVKDKL